MMICGWVCVHNDAYFLLMSIIFIELFNPSVNPVDLESALCWHREDVPDGATEIEA